MTAWAPALSCTAHVVRLGIRGDFGEHYEERNKSARARSVVARIVHRQSGAEFAAKSSTCGLSACASRSARRVCDAKSRSCGGFPPQHRQAPRGVWARTCFARDGARQRHGLLDLILSRSSFSGPGEADHRAGRERDRLPAREIHRAPRHQAENVLILTETANNVRLLDFALEMIGADMGSVAKRLSARRATWRPSRNAEQLPGHVRPRGRLLVARAAVYVMLVARFPEFGRTVARTCDSRAICGRWRRLRRRT